MTDGDLAALPRRAACARLLAAPLALLGGCAGTGAGPAVEPYTAETTYRKLVGAYPFIRIASDEPGDAVELRTGLVYAQRGDHALALDLLLPRATGAGARRPPGAIVLVHGGGWRSGDRRELRPLAVGLARRGHVAACISYRLSGEARYPAAVHDVKAALRWLRGQAAAIGLDEQRIAVGGGSAGGQLASLAGVTNGLPGFDDPGAPPGAASSAAQAIVNLDGLSDFTSEAARRHEDDPRKQPSAAGAWLGGRYAQARARWHEASPLTHAGAGTPPMLFVTSGEARFSVGCDDMVARLRPLGVPVQVRALPDAPHSFWLFEPWLAPTVDTVADFLGRYL